MVMTNLNAMLMMYDMMMCNCDFKPHCKIYH